MNRFGHRKPVAFILAGGSFGGLCLWPGYATADSQQKSDPVDPLHGALGSALKRTA